MTIIYEPEFYEDFTEIYDFIALDSQSRANTFTSNYKIKFHI